MDSIQRQILQMKIQQKDQEEQYKKIISASQDLIREFRQLQADSLKEIEQLRSQQEVSAEQTPKLQNSQKEVEQLRSQQSDRAAVPTMEELIQIAGDEKASIAFLRELDNWISSSDRAAQEAAHPQSQSKWFGEGREPDISDMLDPRNFNEILTELEKMQ